MKNEKSFEYYERASLSCQEEYNRRLLKLSSDIKERINTERSKCDACDGDEEFLDGEDIYNEGRSQGKIDAFYAVLKMIENII